MKLGNVALILLLAVSSSVNLYAEDCSSSSVIPNLTSANFPNADCSFSSLNVNPQSLRFGRLTFGGGGGNFFADPFVNLGSRLYRLDENIEIFDASDDDCEFDEDEDSFFINNESVAFVLSGDSLNAPRVITQLWILDCDINSTR